MLRSGTVQVDGVEYRWSIYRQPRWTSEGMVGKAILVKTTEPGMRELLLEFAVEFAANRCTPQRQFRISDRRLTECIQNATHAGWDPSSRGKPFRFDAGPVNPN